MWEWTEMSHGSNKQQPNGRNKRNEEKVKIHIFHFVAHTSIKCVIIPVNLWHYSIVVIWHFVRSFVHKTAWPPNTKKIPKGQNEHLIGQNYDGITSKNAIFSFFSLCILRTLGSVIKKCYIISVQEKINRGLLKCRETNDFISLTSFVEIF